MYEFEEKLKTKNKILDLRLKYYIVRISKYFCDR